MSSYDDIADLLDKVGDEHSHIADLLRERDDPEHSEGNETFAKAEDLHADSCWRAAKAFRARKRSRKTTKLQTAP